MKGRRRTESSLKVWKPSYFSKDLVIQNVSKPLVAKLGGGLGLDINYSIPLCRYSDYFVFFELAVLVVLKNRIGFKI